MFTGLIQAVGVVGAAGGAQGQSPRTLEITAGFAKELALGESIAVNGVCLTVTRAAPGAFFADAGAETLACTTVGGWQAGARVHLERALALGERLGGHLVLGHVDGADTVTAARDERGGRLLEIAAPESVAPFLLPKGSIAVDGVSLTINAVEGPLGRGGFSVFLIPETLRRTELGHLAAGAAVNLEADVLGKYVARLLARGRELPGLTLDALRAGGFT